MRNYIKLSKILEILSDQAQRRYAVWLSCNTTNVARCNNARHHNILVDTYATMRAKGTTPKLICDKAKVRHKKGQRKGTTI